MIGQFVAIHLRKVSRHQCADLADAGYQRLRAVANHEQPLHRTTGIAPLRGGYKFVVAAIGNDLDMPISPEHVDKYTVVILCIPDTKLPEGLQRTFPGRDTAHQISQLQLAFDSHPDFAAVRALALYYGILYRPQAGCIETPAQSPGRRGEMPEQACAAHGLAPTSVRWRRRRRSCHRREQCHQILRPKCPRSDRFALQDHEVYSSNQNRRRHAA